MSQANSIHDFDVNLIVEYYSTVERQGCGSPRVSLKALDFLEGLTAESHLADIGCGMGGQTRAIASGFPGKITGIDLFPTFVDLFNAKAAEHQLQDRLKGRVASMEDLPFQKEELDVIWSEGAIYNMGYEKGLQEWRKFLKKDGYIVVSEACWFTEKRPQEIQDFWIDAYPGIDTIPVKLQQMQEAGYRLLAFFALPENCWTTHFYDPQVQAQKDFLQKHKGNAFAEGFIANQRHEEMLYRKYKEYYGYAFFIGQKIG